MFRRILIANRGEIACRVIRTAKRLGIATVAVASDADAKALHAALADAVVRIGPAPAAESYLNIGAIVAAAKESRAEAVHPGYGFLAENADFAEACERSGLAFVGPPPAAIRAMGAKDAAKERAAHAGVPVLAGYHGPDQRRERLAAEAAALGYPVLLKAVAGGGGRGLRVVEDPALLADALAAARREAESAFGDGRLIVETYLPRARHVEVQVFADRHGGAVHLFDRDCSLQRRHQKIVEEAPAPGLAESLRRAMGEAAVRLARAIGYRGAGTVEFLVDGDARFHFMEMNTRLQVEHPVTEMITGLDLVEWQLRVAAGERLPLGQAEIAADGHAVEARLYAEDPARGFLPASGTLARFRLPGGNRDVRVDAGFREGDAVPRHYDALLAKVVARGRDRAEAAGRLGQALGECQVAGLPTNLDFLSAIAAHPAFLAGEIDTGFVARHGADLVPKPASADATRLALAALWVALARAREARAEAERAGDPHSPWAEAFGWRLNGDGRVSVRFADAGREIGVDVRRRAGRFLVDLPGRTVEAAAELGADGAISARVDGVPLAAAAVRHGASLTLFLGRSRATLGVLDPLAAAAAAVEAGSRHLSAPMPGRIVEVRVRAGDAVRAGSPLLVMEAMKMEHTVVAPADGTVRALHFGAGSQVEEGALLLDFEARGAEAP
jgi:3-methylcrotonyl-CoA carboxylase alpha subunit